MPNSFRISPDLASRIRDDLIALGQDDWSGVEVEIQYGGKNIYVTVELTAAPVQDVLDKQKAAIAATIGRQIPSQIDGQESWLVALRYVGETVDVVDSVDFDCSLSR